MAVVVDASALAAVAFGEAGSERMRGLLQGHALMAPTLVDYELASVAWKKLRRVPADAEAILAALAAVRRVRITRVQPDMVQALALAAATGLSPYDASYLWVAKSLSLRLVTLDRELAKAAERL